MFAKNKKVVMTLIICLLAVPSTQCMFGRAKQAIKSRPIASLFGASVACALPAYEVGNRMSREDLKLIIKGEKPTEYIHDVWARRLPFFSGGVSYDENYKLFECIEKGDVDAVRDLLVRGTDVNIRERDIDNGAETYAYRKTPLMVAVEKGNAQIVGFLLSRSADINAQDTYGNSVAAYAAGAGKPHSVHIMRTLLRAGVKLQTINRNDETPCANAARSGSLEMVKLLAGNGVDLKREEEAFRCAAAVGSVPMLQLFLDAGMLVGGTPGISGYRSAVDYAAFRGRVKATKFLLAAGDHPSSDIVFYVDNVEVLNLLLDHGVPVDTKDDSFGRTVLVHNAYLPGVNIHLLEALLARGADIDAQDNNGCSALMHLARNNNVAGIVLARQYGASTELKDSCGRTALDFVVDNVRRKVSGYLPEDGELIEIYANNPTLYSDVDKALFEALTRPIQREGAKRS